jgi:hypothetical protein
LMDSHASRRPALHLRNTPLQARSETRRRVKFTITF